MRRAGRRVLQPFDSLTSKWKYWHGCLKMQLLFNSKETFLFNLSHIHFLKCGRFRSCRFTLSGLILHISSNTLKVLCAVVLRWNVRFSLLMIMFMFMFSSVSLLVFMPVNDAAYYPVTLSPPCHFVCHWLDIIAHRDDVLLNFLCSLLSLDTLLTGYLPRRCSRGILCQLEQSFAAQTFAFDRTGFWSF